MGNLRLDCRAAVSHVLLMIVGPVLGAYADLRANKKQLLLTTIDVERGKCAALS